MIRMNRNFVCNLCITIHAVNGLVFVVVVVVVVLGGGVLQNVSVGIFW